jgi:hypothetical protein
MSLDIVPNSSSFSEARWRRRVGLDEVSTKVFVCSEDFFYIDLRTALTKRGWRQAPWGSTPYWSMAIALKPIDIDHTSLRPGQTCNSFSASTALCNKASLIETLTSNERLLPIPLAAFVPRSYDLDEPDDYAGFIDDFRATAALGILRAVAASVLTAAATTATTTATATSVGGENVGAVLLIKALDAITAAEREGTRGNATAVQAWDSTMGSFNYCYKNNAPNFNLGVLSAAIRVSERAIPDFDDDIVLDGGGGGGIDILEPPLATDAEWQIVRWCSPFLIGGPVEQQASSHSTLTRIGSGSGGTCMGTSGAMLAQLEKWRERGEREASSRSVAIAASRIFDPNIGDPLPEITAVTFPELSILAPITPLLWSRLAAVLKRSAQRLSAQACLSGVPAANVWIVKPAGKSRGRGIACEVSLARILARRSAEAGATKATGGGGFICQKYLERPLLIKTCKFDIRQWALVTSWSPLEVWVYSRPYLRFCAVPFSLDLEHIADRYAHLSNNSVQKHSSAFGDVGDENMWHAADFAKWLQEQAIGGAWEGLEYQVDEAKNSIDGEVGFEKTNSDGGSESQQLLPVNTCLDIWNAVIVPRIRRVLLHTLICGQELLGAKSDASQCFEQYGFDLMIDATLRVWLIEVNSAPDMSYSTRVTADLVPEASEGMAAILCEWAAWSKAGGVKSGVMEPNTSGWEKLYKAPDAVNAAPSCLASGLSLAGKSYVSKTSQNNFRSSNKPPIGPHTLRAPSPRSAAIISSRPLLSSSATTPVHPRSLALLATSTPTLNLLPRVALLGVATSGVAVSRRAVSASGTGARAVHLLSSISSNLPPTQLRLTTATIDFAPPHTQAKESLRSVSASLVGGRGGITISKKS